MWDRRIGPNPNLTALGKAWLRTVGERLLQKLDVRRPSRHDGGSRTGTDSSHITSQYAGLGGVLVSWTFVLVRTICRDASCYAKQRFFFRIKKTPAAKKEGKPQACGRFLVCSVAFSSGGDYDEA